MVSADCCTCVSVPVCMCVLHTFLSRFDTESLFYFLFFVFFCPTSDPNHPHNILCGSCSPQWRMVIWWADLHLTFGSGGISRVGMTRGWHLCIPEDLFTLSNVDGFPADPDMEVYDQTSVLLVFDKPPLADTEMLLVKHMIKTLVPPVCCCWCHQRLDPAMHHSHSVWQAG